MTAPGTRQKKMADAPDSSLETGQGGAVMGQSPGRLLPFIAELQKQS